MHSNSTKEKEAPKPNNVGEKLIEVEKAETGSVSCMRSLLIFKKTICLRYLFFMTEKLLLFLRILLFFRVLFFSSYYFCY